MCRVAAITLLTGLGLWCCQGCGKGKQAPDVTEAGPGNWARLGPVGLSIESVRLGRVRMSGDGSPTRTCRRGPGSGGASDRV